MALTEQQRTTIYNSLADTVGPQEAEFLMAQQPPGGWEQFATKQDLHTAFVELNAKIDVGFAQLREQLAEQFAAIETRFAAVDNQFAEVKEQFAEVKEQFAEVKEQFAAVHTQFAAVDTRFAALSDRRAKDIWGFVAAVTVMTVSVCASVFMAAWQFAPS